MSNPSTLSPIVRRAAALREAPAHPSPMLREIEAIYAEVETHVRAGLAGTLHIGMRLLHLHRETGEAEAPGGFRAALQSLSDRVAPSTAYRWLNAASATIARTQGIQAPDGSFDPAELILPAPGSPAWLTLEAGLTAAAQGMSMRRLLIGSSSISDESRMDTLITASENGDPHADAMLDRIAKGEFTLVQAIRAAGGATATKDKERHDPVYLDIDGATGRLKGLFPKCIITLANTFRAWDSLDESARHEARAAWKTLVVNIPKELR